MRRNRLGGWICAAASAIALFAGGALTSGLRASATGESEARAAAAQGEQSGLSAEMRGKINRAAEDALAKTGVPSASIAVVRDGQMVYAHAYGKARLEPAEAARADMAYSVGSISKQFTATAMLMLQEDGKVSIDDHVSRWLPDLTRANEVTIRELLSHTSGYQDYWPQDYVMPSMLKPTTTQYILDTWAKKPLDYEPGTRYQYSNTGYVIAGAIIEKASGMPLLQFLRERVFKPLGMESIIDVNMGKLPADAPTGYMRYALGPLRPAPKEGPGWLFAAGELAMTASDLAKWDIGMIDQKLLKPESYREMQTEVRRKDGLGVGYGLGVGIHNQNGHRAIEHGGEVSGFVSYNGVFPDDRDAIIVLTNQDSNGAPDEIAAEIRGMLFSTDRAENDAAVARAKKLLEGLQHGTIDRSLLSDNCNAYFDETALKDFASSLGPLGAARSVSVAATGLRGGMVLHRFIVKFENTSAGISEYDLPDGKIEQFEVEPL
jgi:D-alanyl-D-alanine carboxypeptidase